MNSPQIIETFANGERPSRSEIVNLLRPEFEDEEALFAAADETRRRYVGDAMHLRAIIEFGNYCERNCVYCGLRRDNDTIQR